MTPLLLLLAAPSWADSADRSAREWSDWVVDQIDAYGKAVQEMQADADDARDLAASRCLAPKSGELERLGRQGDQAQARYKAAVRDDSEYAQYTAEQELDQLLERAALQYNQASACGVALVPAEQGGLTLDGRVMDLAWRASDGVTLRSVYFEPGIDLQAGWAGNPLLDPDEPTSSLWSAMTPRMQTFVSWRSWDVQLSGNTRLSKWTTAPERDELGTWDAYGALVWSRGEFSLSGAGYSTRQAAVVTPWPELAAPYAMGSDSLTLDMHGVGRSRFGLAAWGALNRRSVQGESVDRQRQALPLTGELVLGGRREGVVFQGGYERFGWESQDALALQPVASGQIYSARAGIRRLGGNYLSALYGVAWVDTGAGPERGWVGRTDLNIGVRGVTLGGYHGRSFSDHWLAPTATHHQAGGTFSTWVRGVEVHGSGGWGVERPGDLALRSVEFGGGLRYELPMNTAVDLSGGWEQRTAIEGTDPALGYTNPKVMLTLEVF